MYLSEVKFRPHNGTTVVMLLGQQPGATVQASGYGMRNAFGTVVDTAALLGEFLASRPIAIFDATAPGPVLETLTSRLFAKHRSG